VKDPELFFAQEYNRQLVELSHQESQLNIVRHTRPTLRDIALLRLGNTLIYLGQRLRNASLIAQPVDLSQECA